MYIMVTLRTKSTSVSDDVKMLEWLGGVARRYNKTLELALALSYNTLTFGKSFDRRQTSLCISVKKSRLKNFTILPKLVICLAVLFLAKTNESSPKQIGICKTLVNQEFFTLESVLTGENLREVEIRHLLSLYALSKTKHTSHRSFFQFLIILSGDVSLNPGPVRHPCSSCLKPVAKNHRAILCDNCDLWAHIKCENISTKIYAEMANSNKQLNSSVALVY